MVRNKNNNKPSRISASGVALISASLIVIGALLASTNFISEKRLIAYDYMNTKMATAEVIDTSNVTVVEETNESNSEVPNSSAFDLTNYIGYLQIPKINFNRGFYALGASANNVEENIEVIAGSQMPDVKKGNLIIAGHSGTGWKAFFNELYQLNVGDQAQVVYQDKTYTYQITNIYKAQKIGKIAIKRDYTKTSLTLVTCTNNDSTTQTIYIAELIETT